jgi:FixJ family two-component response regulator
MSGFELYGQFAEREHQPPAVFITAKDEPADNVEAARLGAKGFLHKPYSGRALLDALNQAMTGNLDCVK